MRPYGVKGFPSVKKKTPKPTTQVAHFEPEGEELIENPLAAGAALGIGAAGLALMNRLRNQKKKSDQGKGDGGLVDRLNQRRKSLEGM